MQIGTFVQNVHKTGKNLGWALVRCLLSVVRCPLLISPLRHGGHRVKLFRFPLRDSRGKQNPLPRYAGRGFFNMRCQLRLMAMLDCIWFVDSYQFLEGRPQGSEMILPIDLTTMPYSGHSNQSSLIINLINYAI